MHWGSFTILHFRAPSALGGVALELGYTLVMLCVCCYAGWLSDSPDVSPAGGCGARRLAVKSSGWLSRLLGARC